MQGDTGVVVIGAGMGGLAAALGLAAKGVRVTVVEAGDLPGGKARGVPTPSGLADTGPTVLTMRHVLDAIFAECGTRTEDELTLIPLPRLARHFWPDGAQLDLFTDFDANVAAIEAAFGVKEAAAFRRFDKVTRGLWEAFNGPVIAAPKPNLGRIIAATLTRPKLWPALRPGLSMRDLLQAHFSDPRLVQLFGRYATYVGGRPAQTPGVLSLIWQAEVQGVWAIAEGMHGVAAALTRVAERMGVQFHYNSRAKRIVRKEGRVTAVEIENGTSIPCSACVFNGDPGALRDGLLGDAARASMEDTKRPEPSLSAWVWAFGAKPKGVELAHHNVFFTADPELEFGPIGVGRMPEEPTLYICAQDREMGTELPEWERFEIIMNGPAGHQPFPQEESQCRARTFPILESMGLSFEPEPGSPALTTPALLSRRFPGSQGAIYGGSPEGTLATFQRPLARTGLKGLYLAGGGTHPGAGVPMALTSGRHAARALTSDRISAAK
ncbi:methoxyneurosporene dehydrogenase [Rhodobacter sp. TJ_12]|uniref:1-hydroxycarotenoid 3,4-desaturase CrtD n=1 Tax=Rhodobacter sp. TJ_12 TaxID=2029399 RepID=UPI001CC03E94|nr:1-hydroxycarotenoid 3,4-desaturase CrtD [Rhodobacter sp. TJ_12]MBZ4022335.1 methoxyneurosporene dehydrogenase [Rhodobacter sp. TJ_12]